jgi:hypothetical protein
MKKTYKMNKEKFRIAIMIVGALVAVLAWQMTKASFILN